MTWMAKSQITKMAEISLKLLLLLFGFLIQPYVELGVLQRHFDGDGGEGFGTLTDLCLHEGNMCPHSILRYVQS